MLYSEIFDLANKFVLLGWLLLIVAPKWKYTQCISTSIVVFMLSLIYSVLIIQSLHNFDLKSFSTLTNVQQLFQQEAALLAGWVHYLAFDLLVGSYILQQTQQRGIPHFVNFILLPVTFLFGPLGYSLFVLISFIKHKNEIHQNAIQ